MMGFSMTKDDVSDNGARDADTTIDEGPDAVEEPALTGILKPRDLVESYDEQADRIVDGIRDADEDTKLTQTASAIVDDIASERPEARETLEGDTPGASDEQVDAAARREVRADAADVSVPEADDKGAESDVDSAKDEGHADGAALEDGASADATTVLSSEELDAADGAAPEHADDFERIEAQGNWLDDIDDEDTPTGELPVVPVIPAREPAQAAEGVQDASKKKKKHTGLKVLLVVLIVLAVIVGGCCAALAYDDGQRIQKVPTKTMLDGNTDVSGMTADELSSTIKARMESGLVADVKLTLGTDSFSIDLRDVGTVDTQKTVDAAFAPYDKPMWERWIDRVKELFGGTTETYNVITVCVPSADQLSDKVTEIASGIDKDPKDAGYTYDKATNALKATAAEKGQKVNVDATVAAIQDEILAVGEKNAAVIAVKGEIDTEDPKVTTPGQAIYVDTNACRVHLYENGSEVKSYPCTPGKSGYSTPKGDWKLSYKDASPTWYNPHSEWAADMPESIPPGPNNPLGLRALAVSCGGGIFLHGTTNTGQLGSPGSHGCVRLANSDIVELYNRVSAGIPIFIR